MLGPTASQLKTLTVVTTKSQIRALTCKGRTSRQRSCNQTVSCLLCSMARINIIWDGPLHKRKVRGLVPCCGQDAYRAQEPKHSIDSYRYISRIHILRLAYIQTYLLTLQDRVVQKIEVIKFYHLFMDINSNDFGIGILMIFIFFMPSVTKQ